MRIQTWPIGATPCSGEVWEAYEGLLSKSGPIHLKLLRLHGKVFSDDLETWHKSLAYDDQSLPNRPILNMLVGHQTVDGKESPIVVTQETPIEYASRAGATGCRMLENYIQAPISNTPRYSTEQLRARLLEVCKWGV